MARPISRTPNGVQELGWGQPANPEGDTEHSRRLSVSDTAGYGTPRLPHSERGARITLMSTYSSLNYHIVFSTKLRAPTIEPDFQEALHAYIGGTIRGLGGSALGVGGVADHVHVLAALRPVHCIADVVLKVK